MDLATFNSLAPEAAAEVVRAAADVPAWVDALVDARPYRSVATLLAAADSGAAAWSGPEVDIALAQHPRIGEVSAGAAEEAALSASEQSGIRGEEIALAEGNRAYEERFGRIFLVRAAGLTATDVLEQLTTRLRHDPESETTVVAGQLREIALLRLEGMITA